MAKNKGDITKNAKPVGDVEKRLSKLEGDIKELSALAEDQLQVLHACKSTAGNHQQKIRDLSARFKAISEK